MDLSDVVIDTERLRLVPISMDYAEVIFAEFTDEVTEFMYPRPAKEIEETREFISGSVANLHEGSHLTMAILDRVTGQFLGCAGLHGLSAVRPEFGVWLKKSAHGNHFGFEAVSALAQWARQNLKCATLCYPVDERNTPSRRIPERLGGSVVGQSIVTSMSGRELRLLDYEIPVIGAQGSGS